MRPSPRLIEARFFIFLLVKENMKDLYSFNLVTLLNCGKIRYLNKDSADPCHFYDVSFFDLKDLQIENVIKAVGLYPIPFFSVKLADRKTHAYSIKPCTGFPAIRARFPAVVYGLNSSTRERATI